MVAATPPSKGVSKNIGQSMSDEISNNQISLEHGVLHPSQTKSDMKSSGKTNVVIMYFTQLLGLALGVAPRKLGIHENVSDATDLMIDKRLLWAT